MLAIGFQMLWIPGVLPGLNEMLALMNRNRHQYNSVKKKIQAEIVYRCMEQGIKPVESASFLFTWVEKGRRRDPDNIVAGRKFILDALVSGKYLPGDGWRYVLGFEDQWEVRRDEPGVYVRISEVRKEKQP